MALGAAPGEDLVVPEVEEVETVHPLARVLSALLLVTAANGFATAAAYADDGARKEGRCARGIEWRMEAEPDDGRIEVKVKIETDRPGKRWTWVLTHNGSLSDRGRSRTRGSDGSFEVERTAVDVDGPDTFTLRATRKAIKCVARVTM